jgi:hypothetical protein
MAQYTNVFWIGGNLVLDLTTGKMSQVFLLVYKEEEASTFSEESAENVKREFGERAAPFSKIRWEVQKSKARKGLFVVKGEQDV